MNQTVKNFFFGLVGLAVIMALLSFIMMGIGITTSFVFWWAILMVVPVLATIPDVIRMYAPTAPDSLIKALRFVCYGALVLFLLNMAIIHLRGALPRTTAALDERRESIDPIIGDQIRDTETRRRNLVAKAKDDIIAALKDEMTIKMEAVINSPLGLEQKQKKTNELSKEYQEKIRKVQDEMPLDPPAASTTSTQSASSDTVASGSWFERLSATVRAALDRSWLAILTLMFWVVLITLIIVMVLKGAFGRPSNWRLIAGALVLIVIGIWFGPALVKGGNAFASGLSSIGGSGLGSTSTYNPADGSIIFTGREEGGLDLGVLKPGETAILSFKSGHVVSNSKNGYSVAIWGVPTAQVDQFWVNQMPYLGSGILTNAVFLELGGNKRIGFRSGQTGLELKNNAKEEKALVLKFHDAPGYFPDNEGDAKFTLVKK